MNLKSFSKFNDILNISTSGDYEAHMDNGCLVSDVAHFTNAAALHASLKLEKDIRIFCNSNITKQYLDFLDSENVEISVSDNAILVWDDKMDVLIPMITEEIALATMRPIKIKMDYSNGFVVKIPITDINKVWKIASKLEEKIFSFVMDDYLKIVIKNKISVKYPTIKGDPFTWSFNESVIDCIKHASGDVTFSMNYNTKDLFSFSYDVGAFLNVNGVVAPVVLND